MDKKNIEEFEIEIIDISEKDLNSKTKSSNSNQTMKFKKNEKFKWLVKIVFLLAAIGALIVGWIHFYRIKPKILFVKAVEELTSNISYLSTPLKNFLVFPSENEKLSGNINFTLQLNLEEQFDDEKFSFNYQEIVENMNNLNIIYNYQKDKNNNAQLNLLGNLNDKTIFDVYFLNINDTQYTLINNVFEKYIELGNVNVINNLDINENIEDVKYLWEIIFESLNEEIKNEEIFTEKVKINIGQNEESSAKKTTLRLSNNRQKEIIENIILDLKNDEEAVKIISKYKQDWINQDVKKLVEEVSFETNFIFSVYYKDITNEIIMMELIDELNNKKLVYKKGIENTIDFYQNNELIYQVTFKIDEEQFNINASDGQNMIINISGKQTESGYVYTGEYIKNDVTITGNYILKQVLNEQTQEYNVSRESNFKKAKKGKEIISLNITDYPKIVDEFQIIEKPTNIVKISELTEEEIEEIMNNLSTIFAEIFGISFDIEISKNN